MENPGTHRQDVGLGFSKEKDKNIVARVAAFFGEETAKRVGDADPNIQKLLAKNWDRLVVAGDLALFRYDFSMGINVEDLESVAQMSDENFSFLESLARRYGGSNLVVLSRDGILDTILKNPNLRHVCEALLEQSPENLVCIYSMIDTDYEELLKTQEGMRRFEEGLDRLNRWKNLFGSAMSALSTYEFTWIIMESEAEDIERLEKEIHDSNAARIFGRSLLREGGLVSGELKTEVFWKRIELYNHLFTPEKIAEAGDDEHEYKDMARSFVVLRSSFLEAVLENVSVEDFTTHYANVEALNSFLKTAKAADLEKISYISEGEVDAWKNREQVPVMYSDELLDKDGAVSILEDILRASGMDEVSRQYVGSIVVKINQDSAAGRCSPKANRISMYYGNSSFKNPDIPGVLFHEIGHGVNFALKAIPNGQALFDKYAIKAVYFGPNIVSQYPEAIAMMEGRESTDYLLESFAEDFRALVEYPLLIPVHRRVELEELWKGVLPEVDLEEIRGKIRNMYAAFYGVNAKNIQRPDACEVSKDFANYLARTDAEDAREEVN